nr:uncharacterized protein LOC129486886 isoform X4 [Symphalangus syndactylus]
MSHHTWPVLFFEVGSPSVAQARVQWYNHSTLQPQPPSQPQPAGEGRERKGGSSQGSEPEPPARVFPVSPLARNWAPLSLQPHPAPTSQHLPADEPPEDGQQVLALPLTCPPPLSPCGDLRRSCPASQSSSQPVHPQFLWGNLEASGDTETTRRQAGENGPRRVYSPPRLKRSSCLSFQVAGTTGTRHYPQMRTQASAVFRRHFSREASVTVEGQAPAELTICHLRLHHLEDILARSTDWPRPGGFCLLLLVSSSLPWTGS